jgi:hypothetical protein
LTNFTAIIVSEVKLDDGSGFTQRRFSIEGNRGRAEIAADRFDSLSWVTREWGAKTWITPGPYYAHHVANAIKAFSDAPERTVFVHLGWRQIEDQLVFLHAGGAIGMENVEIDMAGTLAHFSLPPVTDLKKAVRASLRLLDVAPARVSYPVLGAIYRAPLGHFVPNTTTLWLWGKTGVLKTSLALLAQAHFAPALSSPAANWASTANANEKLAFLAKDVLFLIDDFAPNGPMYEVQKMHQSAERLIRGYANQGGRQRMNPDASLKPETHPRCSLIGSGEDIPRGHSLRARMVVVEIKKGDVKMPALTTLQAQTQLLGEAMSGYIEWVAQQDKNEWPQRARELRAQGSGGHLRTPENIASLQWGWKPCCASPSKPA